MFTPRKLLYIIDILIKLIDQYIGRVAKLVKAMGFDPMIIRSSRTSPSILFLLL